MIVLAVGPIESYLVMLGQTRYVGVPYRVTEREQVHLRAKMLYNRFRSYDDFIENYTLLWRTSANTMVHPLDFRRLFSSDAPSKVVATAERISPVLRLDADLTEREREIVKVVCPRTRWLLLLEGVKLLDEPFRVGRQYARAISDFDDQTLKEIRYHPLSLGDQARFFTLLTALEGAQGDAERRNALCASHFITSSPAYRYKKTRRGILGRWHGNWTLRAGWRRVFHKRFPDFRMTAPLDAAPEDARMPKYKPKVNQKHQAKRVESEMSRIARLTSGKPEKN